MVFFRRPATRTIPDLLPSLPLGDLRHFHLGRIAVQDTADLGEFLDLLAQLQLLLLQLPDAFLQRVDVARDLAQVVHLALEQFLVLLELQGQRRQRGIDPGIEFQSQLAE